MLTHLGFYLQWVWHSQALLLLVIGYLLSYDIFSVVHRFCCLANCTNTSPVMSVGNCDITKYWYVSEWVTLTDGLSCAQLKVRWGALWTSRRDGDMLWSAYVVLMFQTCWRHCGCLAVSSTLRSWPPPTPTGITVSVSAFIPRHFQCRQLPGQYENNGHLAVNQHVVRVIWHTTASPTQTDGSVVFTRCRQCSLPWGTWHLDHFSAIFAQFTAESPYTLQECPFPLNCTFPWGIWTAI